MVIDFSEIDFKETPILVLKNAEGTALQTLGYAYNSKAEIRYNEISSITFDLPAHVDGIKTPCYDEVVGMRIIDMIGYGQFILVNPSITNDGIKEIKECKAYSLEYEFTYKKMSIAEGTYNFYNPLTPDDTIIGIILSYMPSWSVGEIDSALYDKYRTFGEDNVNIFNFIKSTVQKTYGCIFDFDTYNRKINVKSTSSDTDVTPVYISLENLAKEIEVEEDTENIFTVLDVNGADGVTIRSVNPMGTNKIYNLDYYMTPTNFSDDMIRKWNEWKSDYTAVQRTYYNITIESMLLTSSILTKQRELYELQNETLAGLENQRSVYIEHLSSLPDSDDLWAAEYKEYEKKLHDTNIEINNVRSDIGGVQDEIAELEENKALVLKDLEKINEDTSFSHFFTDDEIELLNRYFKEDSISESSFVFSNVKQYNNSDMFSSSGSCSFTVTNAEIVDTEYNGKAFYEINGGTLSINGGSFSLSAAIINGTLERRNDNSIVFSCYLSKGTADEESFPSGTLTAIGDISSFSHTSSGLSCGYRNSKNYFTKNATEYEQHSVEWDLFEYGRECLNKLAYPSYSFDVNSANFFVLDEFRAFVDKISLGKKVYISLGEDKILQPILIGADIDFEDPTSLTLLFGDKYNVSDGTFGLVDLLDQSISMGKTVDTSRFSYNSFIESGAHTAVKSFMDSALDVSKNAVLSSVGMAVSWDSSGIHCRKWNDAGTGYEPEEIAVINNNIVFTGDSWEHAKMAIGHFMDTNAGDVWGVVAPNVVGTLLAGQNLIIESAKKDGGTSVFRVDGDGAFLYNTDFNIVANGTQITLNPDFGIAIGDYPVYTGTGAEREIDENNAKFWVDTDGNLHLKGSLEACDGSFTGVVKAADFQDRNGNSMLVNKDNNYKLDAKYLSLYGLEITNGRTTTLEISSDGSIYMSGDIHLGKGSSIDWGYVNYNSDWDLAGSAYDNVQDLADGNYSGGTFINDKFINSPTIKAGEFLGSEYYNTDKTAKLILGNQNGGNLGDLTLYRTSGNVELFQVRDEGSIVQLRCRDSLFLETSGLKTFARNEWDFSMATVTGITAKFA